MRTGCVDRRKSRGGESPWGARAKALTQSLPQPPMANPLPWYAAYFGDPKCDLCIGAHERRLGCPWRAR